MKLQKEFVVDRPRAQVAAAIDNERTLEKLLPGTRIESRVDGVRETFTPFSSLGSSREIRFLFQTLPDGNVRFEKVCDGNIWRFLEGHIRLDAIDERMTTVQLAMEGQTRGFVPEITIRAPMREQIEQMSKALRAELERI
jgi:carbon monoxide dehydrogenase subunit G